MYLRGSSKSKYDVHEYLSVSTVFLPDKDESVQPWGLRLRPGTDGPIGALGPQSASTLAILFADILVKAFNTQEASYPQVARKFARNVFDQNETVPTLCLAPPSVDFMVRAYYKTQFVYVGDRRILRPTITIVAARPINYTQGDKRYVRFPGDSDFADYCRGVLEITIKEGMLVVERASGWVGSNAVLGILRKTFDAAVAK